MSCVLVCAIENEVGDDTEVFVGVENGVMTSMQFMEVRMNVSF